MGIMTEGTAIKAFDGKEPYFSDWGTGFTTFYAALRMRQGVIASLVVDTVQT